MNPTNNKILWLGRGVTVLASLAFLISGIMKLSHSSQVVEGFTQFGLQESVIVYIGILELLCVILYLIPATSVLGAVLLTGYLGGATVTHLRVGQSFIAPVILGLVVWLGIYLRDCRLHALLPLRKK